MDRTIVYPGELPRDIDLLNPEKNTMIAFGALLRAAFGVGTYVDGLAGTQTTVASLTVNIAPGSIISLQNVDNTTFGSLAADVADTIVKQGFNLASTQITNMTAPTVAGQSINWLIEAQFLEADTGAAVLPYVNAATPLSPYNGPANAGTSQNTTRTQRVALQAIAGLSATTGTQTTPATTAGWVPLYVVTLAYGQTTITTAQIVTATGAPFIVNKIPNITAGLLAANNLSDVANATTALTNLGGALAGISNREKMFTSSGSWTCPAGITQILVDAAAGGGGAGYGAGSVAGGSGGGGAQALSDAPFTVVPGNVYAIVIGAAGSPGTSSVTATAGGTTSFGSLFSLSGGGLGGNSGGALGAAGGTGGISGITGTTTGSGASFVSVGGNGGGSLWSGGGPLGQGAQPGQAAAGYGGGGGGGAGGNIGGGGSPGFIRIRF